jgi:hypothetical protein
MDSLLPHLVYDLPITIVALLVVGGSLLSSLFLLFLFHRFLPVDLRSAHNDVAGFTIAIVAGWESLIGLNLTLASFKPSDGSTIALKSELIRIANDLFQSRR